MEEDILDVRKEDGASVRPIITYALETRAISLKNQTNFGSK
jgi:hypothetical protein